MQQLDSRTTDQTRFPKITQEGLDYLRKRIGKGAVAVKEKEMVVVAK